MSNYIKHIGGYTLQQLKGYSFDEIKNLFKTTMRRVHIFFSIESEIERVIPELAAGSSKRDAKEELDQESSKRQKIGESSEPAKEPKDKEEELLMLVAKLLVEQDNEMSRELLRKIFMQLVKYAHETLARAYFLDAKHAAMLLYTSTYFTSQGNLFHDPTLYHSLVGALQYLIITYHDLSYAVN
ncbi:hypothetical protein Tco_0668033 [Tanacetum coccineum]